MSFDARAMVRRIGPWLALGAVVVMVAAVIPVARSLWTTTLGVTGEVATGELEPDVVLEFGEVAVACEGEPSAVAVIVNRGESDMDTATSVELWFGAAEGTGYETLVGTQPVGPIRSGATVEVVEALGAGDGRYAFKLSPAGGSGGDAPWSNEIGFTAEQCTVVEPAVAPPPTTLPPEATTTTAAPDTTTTTAAPETTTTTTAAPETTTTSPPETTTTTTAPAGTTTTTTAAPATTTTAPETTTTTAAP